MKTLLQGLEKTANRPPRSGSFARLAAGVLLALAVSGCAVMRHDAIVCGIFPGESAYESGIPVDAEWAR